MYEALALLLAVSPAHRADWPKSWEAGQQYERCGESIANLKKVRSLRGYEDGRWDVWVARAEADREAWGLLAVMEDDLSDFGMRVRLLAYKRLVGDARYLQRWRPPFAARAYPDPFPAMPAVEDNP